MTEAKTSLENYKGKDENLPPKKAVQKASEAVACKEKTIKSLITQVFQLYSNLIMEEARRPWTKILGEQLDVTHWTNLLEVKHTEEKKGLGLPSWTV